jgi:dTDP-4-dehydrorhamnose 3,5-epimerase
MKLTPTSLPGVLILEPRVHEDGRGFLFESFNQRHFREITGQNVQFVQDNQSLSMKGVLRGMHYQIKQPQGKLVRVVHGEVFDVAVDLRRSFPTFGKWVGIVLSAENKKQVWIPEGFAHGFLALSETAELLYKVSNYYAPEHERSLLWNDLRVAISWPLEQPPVLSDKDRAAPTLERAEVYA